LVGVGGVNKNFGADMPRSKGLNFSGKEPQGGDWFPAGRRSGSGRSEISMFRMSHFRKMAISIALPFGYLT
jgi:hypothetical protein